jgi:hypothetical protein
MPPDRSMSTAASLLRIPTPTTQPVTSVGERAPAHVETTAYFVVSEALANVAKYAGDPCERRPRPRERVYTGRGRR